MAKSRTAVPLKSPRIPDVLFSPEAWNKTQAIITSKHKGRNEITWFGIIERRENGDVYIPDVYIPVQEVTSATTECDDVNICMTEAVADGHNPLALRAWFHLHPGSMGTSPSGTDGATTKQYIEDENWPMLLRGIFNNEGSIQMDFFDVADGWNYTNLDVKVDYPCEVDYEKLEKTIEERLTQKKYTVPQTTKTNGRGTYGITNNIIQGKEHLRVTINQLFGQRRQALSVYIKLADVLIDGEDAILYNVNGKSYDESFVERLRQDKKFEVTKLELQSLFRSLKLNKKEAQELFPSFESAWKDYARYSSQH